MSIQKLYDFIQLKVSLTEEDKKLISSKVSTIKVEKGNIILNEGQISDKIYFVISGIYRVYKLEDGKEITSYFNYEYRNQFIAAFVSLLTQQPSIEIVECIDSGEILSINYSDWKELYENSNQINTFGRIMAEFNYVLAVSRIESLQYRQAKDRYLSFINLYPNLLNMIPHHYIASYIGVTPESLSRIRKEVYQK